MSEVDLAHRGMGESSFVRFVAIKRVARVNLADDTYVRMFMDEARINSELHHGNVVAVYDFGKQLDQHSQQEEYFMVMEYVPGLDLRALQRAARRRNVGLPLRFSLSVLHEVLHGLQYAHHKVDSLGRPMNLVHRDINPRNVMLSVRGEVKVIDFGVALAEDRLEKTQGRSLKGKFAYMSPEQIEGSVALDGRTDLYAVGLMLHELVSGRGPFHGLSELQIMHRIVMGQLPPLELPEGLADPDLLRQVHARALSREREQRYPTARDFQADLAAVADTVGGLATQEERAELVKRLAPEEVDGIWERLRQYHESSNSISRAVAIPPVTPLEPTLATPPATTSDLENDTQELSRSAIIRPPLPRKKRPLLVVAPLGALAVLALVCSLGWWVWSLQVTIESAEEPSLADLIAEDVTPEEGDAAALAPEQPGVPEPPPEQPAAQPEPPRSTPVRSPGSRQPSAGSAGSESPRTPASSEATGTGTAAAPPAESEPTAADVAEGAAGSATPAPPQEPEVPQDGGSPTSEPPPAEPAQQVPDAGGPQGDLYVASDPRSLQVWVDGASVGITPYKGRASVGDHQVRVVGPGGQECSKPATVSATRPVYVKCPFDASTGDRDDDNRRRR